jgi:hypothetical protein
MKETVHVSKSEAATYHQDTLREPELLGQVLHSRKPKTS